MGNDLSYPIGKFELTNGLSRSENIAAIRDLPQKIADAVEGLSEEQLDTPYRPGGWTVRQTVHHVADSHINSIVRFKLALTEEESPVIRPYFEERWAELGDSKLPVEVSLVLLRSLHERWTALLEGMSDEDYRRSFVHPESGEWTLENALALYSWHSRHHTAHITSLRERNGW